MTGVYMTLPQMSLSGSFLIAAVLILRKALLYRLPKRTFPALWGVAVMRLLLPFSVASCFGVYHVLAPLPAVSGDIDVSYMAVDSAQSTAAVTYEAPLPPSPEPVSIKTVVFIVWCCGAVLSAVVFTVQYLRSIAEFRCSLPEESPFIQEWLSSHKIRRNIAVRRFDRISSPLTYGVFRPVILLPCSPDAADEERLDCILTHELVHICRFDALKKLVCAAALCLHWFNPLVWVMFFYYNRDLELACDEGVLRRLGTDRRADYARTLIGMECERSGIASFYSRFKGCAAEERINAIMKTKKASIFKSIAACALVCAAAGVFATTAAANDKTGDNTPPAASEPDISPVRFDAPSKLDESAPRDEYKALGLTERESDQALVFDGKLVRWFIDEADVDGNGGYAVSQVYYNENGVIDLHTVRERKYNDDGSFDPFGRLTAIEEMKDFNPACILTADAVTTYEMPAGASDTVYDSVFSFDAGDNDEERFERTLDVVRKAIQEVMENWNPRIGGDPDELQKKAADAAYQAIKDVMKNWRTDIAVEATTAYGTDSGAKGRTFAEIFAAYKDLGITYDEEKNDVYLNGKLVRLFADISEDDAFSFMSKSAGGINVRTVYKDGKLSEIREMTTDEENADLSEW